MKDLTDLETEIKGLEEKIKGHNLVIEEEVKIRERQELENFKLKYNQAALKAKLLFVENNYDQGTQAMNLNIDDFKLIVASN